MSLQETLATLVRDLTGLRKALRAFLSGEVTTRAYGV